jgi:23S rRNA (cytosine1962-C5)-methyltransferase
MEVAVIRESPGLEEGEVRIRKRGAARVRSGHLWVYRSDILEVKDVPAGAITVVRDEQHAVVGKAFYSTQSQIALRFLVRGDVVIDEAFFRRRFEEADSLRSRLGVDPRVSRRIYSEGDFLPGLIVDRYGEFLVVQSLTQGADRFQPRFTSILQDVYHPRSIIIRNDSKVRELEGLPLVQSWIGQEPPQSVVVDEDGKQIEIPLASGQKTGSYLDQRENHRAARRYARGRALDGFCYGGGFALQLADVCNHVEAVDSSSPAVQLAQSNAERNGLRNVTCIEGNVFDFLRERSASTRTAERYDTIVLDPPAFARNKESLEGALRGYKEINHRAMRLLKDGGTLVTCSCSYHVHEGLFAEMLAEAARDAGCWLRVLERRIQSSDHPVLMAVPETLYLKCFILEVRY